MANAFTMSPSGPPGTPPVGAVADTITVTDPTTDNLPVPRMVVYATSDPGGLNVVAGPAITNDAGTAVLLLVPGTTYYLTGLKIGVIPIVNRTFVSVGDSNG